ncbi:hypothetical protein D3C77_360450 [compost metagenome]
MDTDSLLQCLSYLNYTAQGQGQGITELVVPAATTIAGVLIGFYLNILRENNKQGAENKNKVLCITEDIERLSEAACHIFKEAAAHFYRLQHGAKFGSHSFASALSSPSVDKHFIEIANLYNREERHCIVEMNPIIGDLNTILKDLRSFEKINDPRTLTRSLLNAVSRSMTLHTICEEFFLGKPESYHDLKSFAEKVELDPDHTRVLLLAASHYPNGL